VESLQDQDFEQEHGVERRFASLSPVASGVAGELFEQRAKALPGDDVSQLEDANGFGGDGPLVFNGEEQAAASFYLAVAIHRPFL
jgi:hypothetical protein